MDIEITKAILHVLDSAVDEPVLSERALEDEQALAYFTPLAGKAFASDEAKQCTLAPDSRLGALLARAQDDFERVSAQLAGEWFAQMRANPAIPAGDAAFLLVHIDGAEYFAALKLNYKPGWLHYFETDGAAAVNRVVRHDALLPTSAGRADEAFFARLDTGEVRLTEKKYEIDGRKQPYLGRFLGCRAGLSPKEKLAAIREVAVEVNQQFYGATGVDEPEVAAAVCAQYRAAREAASSPAAVQPAPVAELCETLYGGLPHVREAFRKALEERDIALEEPLPLPAAAVRRMEKQSLRSAGGVEIKVPVEVYRDTAALEFIRGEDGSVSLLIKNILL